LSLSSLDDVIAANVARIDLPLHPSRRRTPRPGQDAPRTIERSEAHRSTSQLGDLAMARMLLSLIHRVARAAR
jgi:hypothetical protein